MPKDFLAPPRAGRGYCANSLAAGPEIRPKMAVVWKKALGMKQLRARKKRVAFDTHVWHYNNTACLTGSKPPGAS
jgi:hypothetical protein